MKKFNISSIIAFISLFILSSCTGDNDDIREYYSCGIIQSGTPGRLIYLSDDFWPIYHTNLQDFFDNEAVLANIFVNFDSEDNAGYAQRGYLVASSCEIKAQDIPTNGIVITNSNIDKDTKNENEWKVTGVMGGGFVKNTLFMEIILSDVPEDSGIYYTLEFDAGQTPTVDSSYGLNVYDIYLRCQVANSGSSTTKTVNDLKGFDFGVQLYPIYSMEHANGKDTFFLRINYVTVFDDETIKTWSKSTIAIVPIVETSNQ